MQLHVRCTFALCVGQCNFQLVVLSVRLDLPCDRQELLVRLGAEPRVLPRSDLNVPNIRK